MFMVYFEFAPSRPTAALVLHSHTSIYCCLGARKRKVKQSSLGVSNPHKLGVMNHEGLLRIHFTRPPGIESVYYNFLAA